MVEVAIAIATAVVFSVLIAGFTIVALVNGTGMLFGIRRSRNGSFSFSFGTGKKNMD